jgi:4-diphosphocytidyl-2-C-methyl-D-erythritol kinase
VEPPSIRLISPAKINLGLRIVARRPDGYHDIESAFQMVSLADDIVLTATDGGVACEVKGADLPTDERNLAVKAALALKAHAGKQHGAHISITKRIPVAAGLGGGSSNAAVTLLGLQRLWGLKLPPDVLHSLAASLGADVPFFLTAAAAWAEGKGDRLTPLPPLEGLGVVLVKPDFSVSTAWAYREVTFGLTGAAKALTMLRFLLEKKQFPEIGPYLHNDFEPLVERVHPKVSTIRAALRDQGALGVALSGSGPTVFGLFLDSARAVASELARFGWFTVATEPITAWPEMLLAPVETSGQGNVSSSGGFTEG